MKKKTILIVDDEENLIRALIRAFYLKGIESYEILVSQDGYEALDFMATKEIDLVLLDINMPNLDGSKVCKAAMEDERMRKIPILVTSGHLEEEDKARLEAMGMKHFLDKPYELDELFKRIETLTAEKGS